MTVKCGHCKDVHGSVNEVKLCSRGRLRGVAKREELTVAEREREDLKG